MDRATQNEIRARLLTTRFYWPLNRFLQIESATFGNRMYIIDDKEKSVVNLFQPTTVRNVMRLSNSQWMGLNNTSEYKTWQITKILIFDKFEVNSNWEVSFYVLQDYRALDILSIEHETHVQNQTVDAKKLYIHTIFTNILINMLVNRMQALHNQMDTIVIFVDNHAICVNEPNKRFAAFVVWTLSQKLHTMKSIWMQKFAAGVEKISTKAKPNSETIWIHVFVIAD